MAAAVAGLLVTSGAVQAQGTPDDAIPPPAAAAARPTPEPPPPLPAVPTAPAVAPAIPPPAPAVAPATVPAVTPPAAPATNLPRPPSLAPPGLPGLPGREIMRAAPSAAGAGQAAKPGDTNRTVALKFNGAPLDQVLQFYSDLTGRTLLQAPSINATVTLRSQSELSIPEALQALKTVLNMNSVGLVEVGDKFVKVVPIASVQIEGLPILSNSWQRVRHPENDEMICEIIVLKYIDPAEALKAIQGLIHPYGKILSLERINALMVADTTININRIKEVIELIDQPIEMKEKIHIRIIRHAKASDIKARLEEIIADQKEKEKTPTVKRLRDSGSPGIDTTPATPSIIPGVIRARPTAPTPAGSAAVTEATAEEGSMIRGSVKVIADDRTGILVIITRDENMLLFDQIVNALDVATAPDVNVRMVRLEYADAEVVAAMLNTLIGAAAGTTKDQPKSTAAKTGKEGDAEPAKSSPLQEYLQQQRETALQSPGTRTGDSKTKIGQLSAENIRILADKRSNGLIIMASVSDMAAIMEVLKQMDVMLSQVLIEAVILSVSLDDSMQSGVNWVQRSLVAYNKQAGGGREAISAFAGGGGGDSTVAGVPRDATSLSTLAYPGSGLTYYFTHFGLNIDAIVKWAASDSRTRILSSPVILTTDNKEAKIDVSSQQYVYKGTSYQQVNASNYQSVPNVDVQKVSLNLTVTPHINQNKFVAMEIAQKIDEPGADQTIPGINGAADSKWPTMVSREMSASIAVRSGETIILGGLVKNSKIQSHAKIPILGDIPLLGVLFRSGSDDNKREEVVVFITPRVLDSPEDIEAESRRRKDATGSGGLWQKGWSDSKLADPPPNKFKQWWRNLLH